MVIAVDDRNIDVGGAQGLGCIQPSKTRAQDDDLRTRFGTLGVSHFVCLGIDDSKWVNVTISFDSMGSDAQYDQ